ncbi:hypothetical protein MSHRCOH1_04680 [Candidatus Ornithobacterium hominis]|uniref:hypothetical protein n=1 Tax=Candidatus Ornithobacterium hominis TaxID=2497989 RepID=UPI0024BCEF0A|nr:hypothetical protein [Candidatus Ornithobacterium hominis]CAI9429488.1 hypothetical protein MSHRCOH1_04680 [Candidatus Ornithobacterium hominis]
MKKQLTILSLTFGVSAFAQVGINTDTPQATLEVVSKENSAATSALKIKNSDNDPLITVSNAGGLGIRTDNPTATLDINGTARVRELKGNVSDTEYTRSIVADANGNLGYVPRIDPTVLGTTQLVQGNTVTKEAPFPNDIIYFHDYKQYLAEGNPDLTRYMGQSITLPPGKWVIYYGSLFIKSIENALVEQVNTPSGKTISVVKQPTVWIRTKFFETKEPQDFGVSPLIVPVDDASPIYNSVELTFTGGHTPLYGTFLITLTETKTIYLHAFYDYMENFSNNAKGWLASLGGRGSEPWLENYLYAIKRY